MSAALKNPTGYRWMKANKTRQLMAEMASPRRNKFGAKRTTIDGETFDSKREAMLYREFQILERAGKIKDLRRQPKYVLTVNGIEIATYRPDWDYIEDGALHVIDVKSAPTAKKRDFVLVRKLMKACHGIDVEVMT